MDITNRLKNALAAFRKTENSVHDTNAFLRYGKRIMPSSWSTPAITDEDFYTGIGYAVIQKRANRSVTLGKKFLYTDAKESIIKDANDRGERVIHPYLKLIKASTEFSERDFWHDISEYLDLEGVYYLMAVRTVTSTGRVGNIQRFVMLNPYNIRPVKDSNGNLGGYVEQRNGKQREIPKEMIIPIVLRNPMNPDEPYSLADAARDAQFTMKQANDFAREAINGNLNAPGILSSAIELPDDQFDNFVARIRNGRQSNGGEPIFGNGSGTVTWTNMQTDLDKAALDKINTISRDALLAVSGLSKTGIGIEESGTGREVSRTQKDDFTENAVMPQIETIIDALNLDYRRHYSDQYGKNEYNIALDNPLETDREAEKADVEIRDAQFALLKALVADGYEYGIAAKYAKGLIDITDVGEPVKEEDTTPTGDGTDPNLPDTPATPPADVTPNSYSNQQFDVYEGYPVPVLQYLGDNADQINPLSETSSLIYSNESLLQLNAKTKTVRISHIADVDNQLVGVVDETTFVKLAEFNQNADRIAIVTKLNKRYKNQPVAIKKKIDLDHDCSHNVYESINNSFDKNAHIDSNIADLLLSAETAEEKLYQWYLDQMNAGVSNPHLTSLDDFINSLILPFAVYFTVMFPIYAAYRVEKTAKDLNIRDDVPVTAMTEEVKQMINDFAKKEATSHINTVKTDIENALAIIRAKTSDSQEIKSMFAQAFADIQKRRAQTIANNAAARIFNISQYEADLQFLTRAGLLKNAYKVLFSLTGDPCEICAYIIKATNMKPIPFTSAFVDLGETIEAGGRKMTFDYEKITAGNVHPNCHCAYRLIVDNVA